MQFNILQCRTKNTTQRITSQHNTIKHNAIKHNTSHHITSQHNTQTNISLTRRPHIVLGAVLTVANQLLWRQSIYFREVRNKVRNYQYFTQILYAVMWRVNVNMLKAISIAYDCVFIGYTGLATELVEYLSCFLQHLVQITHIIRKESCKCFHYSTVPVDKI